MKIQELNELTVKEIKKELTSYTPQMLFRILSSLSYSEKYSRVGKLITREMKLKSGMR